MKLMHCPRSVAVMIPPGRKEFTDPLPPSVALLRLADSFGDIFAAKRDQGIGDRPATLLETAQREDRRQNRLEPSPAPNGKGGCQKFVSVLSNLGENFGFERSRLGIFRSWVKYHSNEPARQVLRDPQS